VQVFRRRQRQTLRAFRWPASEKRQGKKSREVARRSGSERYGDLMLAPTSVARAPLMGGNVHVCQDSTWDLGGDAECISERWTASGREAAIRIAERFHNFCVSVRLLHRGFNVRGMCNFK
jgi:hypothetical protein